MTGEYAEIGHLIKLLNDKHDPHLREHAAVALCNIYKKNKSPEVIDALLLEFAHHRSSITVPNWFVEALVMTKDERGLRMLKIVRHWDVAYALELGYEKTIETLKEFVDIIKRKGTPEQFQIAKSDCVAAYKRYVEEFHRQDKKIDMPGELMPAKIKPPAGNRAYRMPLQRRATL